MRDFTLMSLELLIERLKRADYKFIRFNDFKNIKDSKIVILSHDVDLLPGNSLRTAKCVENSKQ